MDAKIKKLLKSNSTDSVFFTHVSLIQPKRKIQFNRQTAEEFWTLYCDALSSSDENEFPIFGIAECAQDCPPVIADIDLKIKGDDEIQTLEGLYTEDQLKNVVSTYQSVLRKIVDNCSDEDLICVVLEKHMYEKTQNDVTYYKHGFHLHFPYCFLRRVDQETQLLPRVKQGLKDLKLFENLGIEDSGEVIDKGVYNNAWLLYGSRKTENSEPYCVTKIYDANQSELTFVDAFRHYQIFDQKERPIPIPKNRIKYFLPRILSIVPYGRPQRFVRKGLVSPLKEQLKKKERKTSNTNTKLSVEESLSVAKILLPMLAEFRTSEFNEWMTVGWILYNISEGSSEGLELWCDFSERCEEKFDENVCIEKWEKMTKRDLSLGTLKWYASIDNPVEYKKYKSENAQKHVKESLNGSHNDVAKALYAEFGDEFVCSSITRKTWYQYRCHKWQPVEEGFSLREKISTVVVKRFIDVVKHLYDDLKDCQEKAHETMINTKIKQINKMIGNLKSAPYKNNVMREAMEVFYDPDFENKLDADPMIFGFMNGAYDFRANGGKGMFRAGRPEDYISKCAPISYIEYSGEEEIVQDVYSFIEQIFPDKSLRKYFLDIYSDIFIGGNHEKIVLFWTGDGDNGKSIMQMFFEGMLGSLAVKLNTCVITGKKPGVGAANADLVRAGGGVRWASLEEPNADEVINIGVFKHLSGGDTIFARDLFQKGKETREIIPMFKLTFICNKLPAIKLGDGATWNRTRVLPFESTFCRSGDTVPETYEEQLKQKRFPADKNFKKKIPSMVSAFAWILIQHRHTVTTKIEPEKVLSATEQYRKQNDIYKQFIEESIIDDEHKTISMTELYSIFKDWFRESLPNNTIPIKNDIEEYFTKLWGAPRAGKKWKGYRQRTLQDDVENGDVVILTEDDQMDYTTSEMLS